MGSPQRVMPPTLHYSTLFYTILHNTTQRYTTLHHCDFLQFLTFFVFFLRNSKNSCIFVAQNVLLRLYNIINTLKIK